MTSPLDSHGRSTTSDLFDKVVLALSDLCRQHSLHVGDILPEHCLSDDLGVDSLHLVDLIVLLEERTGFTDLPVLEWAENESMRRGERFTVRSLASAIEAHARRATERQMERRTVAGRP